MAVAYVIKHHLFSEQPYVCYAHFSENKMTRVESIYMATHFESYGSALKSLDYIENRVGIFQIEKIFYNA